MNKKYLSLELIFICFFGQVHTSVEGAAPLPVVLTTLGCVDGSIEVTDQFIEDCSAIKALMQHSSEMFNLSVPFCTVENVQRLSEFLDADSVEEIETRLSGKTPLEVVVLLMVADYACNKTISRGKKEFALQEALIKHFGSNFFTAPRFPKKAVEVLESNPILRDECMQVAQMHMPLIGLTNLHQNDGFLSKSGGICSGDGVTVFSGLHTVFIRQSSKTEIVFLEGLMAGDPISLSQDGSKAVVIYQDGSAVTTVNTAKKEIAHPLAGHIERVNTAHFSRGGTLIATTSKDKTVRIYDSETGVCKHTLRGHSDELVSAVFSSDDRVILTASLDGTVRFWSTQTGALLERSIKNSCPLNSVSIGDADKRVITVDKNHKLKVWDAETGELLFTPKITATNAIAVPVSAFYNWSRESKINVFFNDIARVKKYVSRLAEFIKEIPDGHEQEKISFEDVYRFYKTGKF